jgi:type I restriction enzyme S subunit
MKLLTLQDEKYDFYFALHTLKNIAYTPQNHERHWISKFSAFSVLVPSLDEQEKIGEFFRQISDLIALHQSELFKLQNMKKALLGKMFV